MLMAALKASFVVALFVLAIWGIGLLIGFEFALIPTLLISVGLTVVLNLVLGGIRRASAT